MASLQEISELLDEKLGPLVETVGSMQTTVGSMKTTVESMQGALGSLVETNLRKEAKSMFGNAFAKRFFIRSLHDAVHLVAKANFKNLTPDAVDERQAAAGKLAEKAKEFAVPLVMAFCLSFIKKYKTDANSSKLTDATTALDNGEYGKCLGLLIGASKIVGGPGDVEFYLQILKKAFPSNTGDCPSLGLLTCDGPGVLLLGLASKYTASELEKESDIFDKGELQVENDMRGTINLVGHHATITCGEANYFFSGLEKAKTQLVVRTRFLKTAIETIFPKTFKEFILIGHMFVPFHAVENATQQPANEVIVGVGGDVSINIHTI